MGQRRYRYLCFSILFSMGISWTAIEAEPTQSSIGPVCANDLETLTAQLLEDLPSYANRTNARLGLRNTYVITAARPEFEPLPLGPGQRAAVLENLVSDDPSQVFLTTLERSYQQRQAVQLQLYHWLFLTQTKSGWRLALMFSMVGPYPAGRPPSPPQDSSEGSLAQAIRKWLQDYRSYCPPPTQLKKRRRS